MHADRRRTGIRLNLWTAVLIAASLTHAAVLPNGAGKPETVRLCGRCHSLDQATSLRQDQAGWSETITKMVNLGTQGSEDELNKILTYLTSHYPAPPESAPGASS